MYDTIASFQLFYVLDLFFFSFLLSMIDRYYRLCSTVMSQFTTLLTHFSIRLESVCIALPTTPLNLCSHSVEAFERRSFPLTKILVA